VKRVLFLGSSCIYPKMAPQPMPEDCLLTSSLEPSNEAYAIAKIAGLKLCQHYRAQHGVVYHSAMPTNLYGPGDNYHPENSHVIPGLIRRFHEAKERGDSAVTIWGTGTPRREFLHVDDLARACFHLLGLDNPPDWVNVGTGEDLTILELAKLVAATVGFTGEILTDPTKPDGTPRKLLDISKIKATGWQPVIPFHDGLAAAYQDFKASLQSGAARL
jgi:GDP-L-fucose synthase